MGLYLFQALVDHSHNCCAIFTLGHLVGRTNCRSKGLYFGSSSSPSPECLAWLVTGNGLFRCLISFCYKCLGHTLRFLGVLSLLQVSSSSQRCPQIAVVSLSTFSLHPPHNLSLLFTPFFFQDPLPTRGNVHPISTHSGIHASLFLSSPCYLAFMCL